MDIRLEIFSPQGVILNDMVSRVDFPGSLGRFEVLRNHAPLISSLESGDITYYINNDKKNIHISSGFVKIKDNRVTACIEE